MYAHHDYTYDKDQAYGTLPDIPETLETSNTVNTPSSSGNQDGRNEVSRPLSSDNIARWLGQEGEQAADMIESKSRPKPRRKANPNNTGQVKHRRTRSGCYTCRSRRVKCDEDRPICERCKKGARECTWPPEPSGKRGSTSKASKQVEPEVNSSGDEDDDIEIEDDNSKSPDSMGPSLARQSSSTSTTVVQSSFHSQTMPSNRPTTLVPEQVKDKSISPSATEETRPDSDIVSLTERHSLWSANTSHDDLHWSRPLKPDHQFYLNYHRESLSYCHYFLKSDFYDFIRTTLIDAAMTYEPLLYAVVGFSAFRYAMSGVDDGQISSFLEYYNEAVTLLRKSISAGDRYSLAMIYTVLQLATFEEYMGDWSNLMIHQQAAYQMIKAIYTPDSMMQSGIGRTLFAWYVRFDTFVGYMANLPSLISAEWSEAMFRHSAMLRDIHPENEQYMMEALNAERRLLGVKMTALLSKPARGEMTLAQFHEENQILSHAMKVWSTRVRALRTNSQHLVWEFKNKRPLTDKDIVDPFEPGVLFDTAWFPINFILLDSMAMETIHKLQTATILQQPMPSDMIQSTLELCQLFEAIQEYEGSPSGMFFAAQVTIGIVCLFLPRDDKHISWCRKMLTRFENSGYIHPPSFRAKVAEGWSMPSIKDSWLPEDAPQPQIIKSLRSFIAERTTKPSTQTGEDVRSLKAVFEKLHLGADTQN